MTSEPRRGQALLRTVPFQFPGCPGSLAVWILIGLRCKSDCMRGSPMAAKQRLEFTSCITALAIV